MSDYFGALIRSSGLRVGPGSAAPAAGHAASGGLVEIHDEREAPTFASQRSVPQLKLRPTEEAAGASPPNDHVGRNFSSGDAFARPGPVASIDSPAERAESPSPTPRASVAPASDTDVTPDTAGPRNPLDPVRIAMQWVAADPEARAAQMERPAVTAPGSPPLPAPSTHPRAADVVSQRIETGERGAPPIEETRPRSATGEPAVRAIVTPPRPDRREAERVPAAVRDRRSAEPAEEIVEISNGAINLHVEGPAPQTIVQSPAAPRGSTPRRRAERSGLARRYLRSF